MIQSLALNMVVYNEAHRIRTTLERILPLVDEAVIIDQSSTDGTAEICEEMGATVYSDRHYGWAEPSRQMAIDKTHAPWILVMDADEHPTSEFIADLRTLDSYPQVRLRVGVEIGGEVACIGPPIFRFFEKAKFYYPPTIHTAAQPFEPVHAAVLPYVAIWDVKTWAEYLAGLANYEKLLHVHPKMAYHAEHNHTFLHRAKRLGLTGADLDDLTLNERRTLGFRWENNG